MTTTSVRTSTIVPVTMEPGLSLARWDWLCSNSSAKDSCHCSIHEYLRDTRAAVAGLANIDPPFGWRRASRLEAGASVVDEPPAGLRTVGLSLKPLALAGWQQRQHALERPHRSQAGGVDAHGVRRRAQRCHRAIGIAGVAGENLSQQTRQCNGNPFFLQLLIASLGPLRRHWREEHPGGSRGRSPSPCRARRPPPGDPAERPLAIAKRSPDFGNGGNRRSRRARRLGPDLIGGVDAVDDDAGLVVAVLQKPIWVSNVHRTSAGASDRSISSSRGQPHCP